MISAQLLFSTFLGGSGGEAQYGPGIAVDSSGNVFVSDITRSPDFPTSAGAYCRPSGGLDRFVVKFDPELATPVCARFGGTGPEFGSAIGIGPHGNVYLAGYTGSPDFPVTENGFDRTHNGGRDLFVMKFDNELKTLLASTFLGGSGDEGQTWPKVDLVLDEDGNVFVAGITDSRDFPTTSGAYDRLFHGGRFGGDAFVLKLSPDLDTLLASTLLGGSEVEWRISTALGADHLLVTGETYSPDFPTSPGAYDTDFNGGSDIFLVKITRNLSSVAAATLLGTAAIEEPLAVKVGRDGEVFLTGYTQSPDFPVTSGAFGMRFGGGERDGFLAKFDAGLTRLSAAAYLGGSGAESCRAMALDEAGTIFLTGNTASADFPSIPAAPDNRFSGGAPHGDAFVARCDSTLSVLQASIFFGEEGDDSGNSIILAADGNLLVAGTTDSARFPTSALGFDRSLGGGTDVFISRLSSALPQALKVPRNKRSESGR
ncbi:MAG: hypothetical protein V2A76_10220 [Planctomycetota bacterium]